MRSKLLSCEHKKWGIEYIRQMKICSNYFRSILNRIKLALFENKRGTNYIHERIKSFQTKLATYETAYAALLEVIEENKSYLFIIANSANNVDPFSPSDFSIKQLDRVRLQCKLILKLLKRLIDRQIVLLNKTRLALTEIENNNLSHTQYQTDHIKLKIQLGTTLEFAEDVVNEWEQCHQSKLQNVSEHTIIVWFTQFSHKNNFKGFDEDLRGKWQRIF